MSRPFDNRVMPPKLRNFLSSTGARDGVEFTAIISGRRVIDRYYDARCNPRETARELDREFLTSKPRRCRLKIPFFLALATRLRGLFRIVFFLFPNAFAELLLIPELT